MESGVIDQVFESWSGQLLFLSKIFFRYFILDCFYFFPFWSYFCKPNFFGIFFLKIFFFGNFFSWKIFLEIFFWKKVPFPKNSSKRYENFWPLNLKKNCLRQGSNQGPSAPYPTALSITPRGRNENFDEKKRIS